MDLISDLDHEQENVDAHSHTHTDVRRTHAVGSMTETRFWSTYRVYFQVSLYILSVSDAASTLRARAASQRPAAAQPFLASRALSIAGYGYCVSQHNFRSTKIHSTRVFDFWNDEDDMVGLRGVPIQDD